jgi:hypothetical protein
MQKLISDIRTKNRKRIEAYCKSLARLWKDMFTIKKAYVKAAGAPKAGLAPHTSVFTAGRWVCSPCGAIFKKRGSGGIATPGKNTKWCAVRIGMQDKGGHARKPLHTHCDDNERCGDNVLLAVRRVWLAEGDKAAAKM